MESKRVVDAADLERLTRAAREVFADEPDVLAVYLYGSAARGEMAADLDVGVLLGGAPAAVSRLERMAAELQRRGAPHGPEIDLRPLNGAGPRFCVNVLREGRLLYESNRSLRLEREARLMSEWADFRPTWQRMRQRMLDRWTRG